MKYKGLRKSKNVQDLRGPTGAYNNTSTANIARSRGLRKFWEDANKQPSNASEGFKKGKK